MPTYEITAPDGQVFEVTAPDGASEQEVLAYAQANFKPKAAWQPTQRTPDDLRANAAKYAAANPVTDDMSFGQNVVAGFGQSFVNTGRGLSQLMGNTSTADVDRYRREDAALDSTVGGTLGNITGQVTQIAVPIPGAAGVKGLAMFGKAAPYARAAAEGAALSGAQPVATGESRATNAAVGGALGVGGQALTTGLRSASVAARRNANPMTRRAIQDAQDAGIPLNVAQTTESPAIKAAAAAAKWLPFSGAGKAANNQQRAFNAAVSRSFGENAPVLTEQVMARASRRMGDTYDQIWARNDVALDKDAVMELFKLHRTVGDELTQDGAHIVRKQIEKVLDNAGSAGAMKGKVYQNLRGELREKFTEGDVGRRIKQLRSVLDDAASRSVGPADAALLKKTNGQYANYRMTQDALKQVEGAKGNIRPASLYPLTRKGSTKEMRRLAQMGQALKEGVGDSGTAQRTMYQDLIKGGGVAGGAGALGGAAMVAPALKLIAGGAIAGRALNSNAAAKAFQTGKPTATLSKLTAQAPRVLPALGNNSRVASLVSAAIAQPDHGPEIIANLLPEEQEAAIAQFAQETGADPGEVAQRVNAASARLAELRRSR